MTNVSFKKFRIETYKPGKSTIKSFKKVIKLSANESALGMSPRVKKVISNKNLNFFRYPDGKSKRLREQISKNLNVKLIKLFVVLVPMKLFKCYANYSLDRKMK